MLLGNLTKKTRRNLIALTVILFGILTLTLYLFSRQTMLRGNADSNPVEFETGTVSGNVHIINDSLASGGKYIQLGELPSPPPSATPTPSAANITIAAAGDIACAPGGTTDCKQRETSDVIATLNPTAVLALGDNQYESGSLANYQQVYHPTWGRFKNNTFPVPGNHEYGTANAAGYFDYFNGQGVASGKAGTRGKGWYSFDLGSWHLIALNSECAEIGTPSCAAGSEQEQWLRADLEANKNKQCTLAFWHHPYYTSGTRGPSVAVKPLVQALFDYNADVILVGHMHFYERFAPQDPNYNLNTTRGIRSFTIGTGGRDVPRLGVGTFKNMEKRDTHTFGVLKLVLNPTSYDFQFLPIAGLTFTDSGTQQCH